MRFCRHLRQHAIEGFEETFTWEGDEYYDPRIPWNNPDEIDPRPYHSAWLIQGLYQIYRATGDKKYAEEAWRIVELFLQHNVFDIFQRDTYFNHPNNTAFLVGALKACQLYHYEQINPQRLNEVVDDFHARVKYHYINHAISHGARGVWAKVVEILIHLENLGKPVPHYIREGKDTDPIDFALAKLGNEWSLNPDKQGVIRQRNVIALEMNTYDTWKEARPVSYFNMEADLYKWILASKRPLPLWMRSLSKTWYKYIWVGYRKNPRWRMAYFIDGKLLSNIIPPIGNGCFYIMDKRHAIELLCGFLFDADDSCNPGWTDEGANNHNRKKWLLWAWLARLTQRESKLSGDSTFA